MTARIAKPSTRVIEWGVCSRAMGHQRVSGDAHAISPFPNGVLIGVVDGLGHGDEAALAAAAAVRILLGHADDPVTEIMQRCHEELRKTRGGVMSLASIRADEGTMTWLGIGNVEGVLFRADRAARPARESLSLRGGVVGYQIPLLRAATVRISPGDTLIFATDGVRGNYCDESPLNRDPQNVADGILFRHGKQTDDALVLVACYLGLSP
jgi:serine phosphatase RsbU (regulator of sigma subunit)